VGGGEQEKREQVVSGSWEEELEEMKFELDLGCGRDVDSQQGGQDVVGHSGYEE
jgi:hypothetical protein